MLAPVAEKISKGFTTYVDLRLRRFEPNFPRSATLNIEKHARCGRTAGRRPGAPPVFPFYMRRRRIWKQFSCRALRV